MAWVLRGGTNFSVLEDEDCCHSPTTTVSSPQSPRPHDSFGVSGSSNHHPNYTHGKQNNPFAALRDIDPNHNTRGNTSIQGSYGVSTTSSRAAEDLAEELRKFHIADHHSETDEDDSFDDVDGPSSSSHSSQPGRGDNEDTRFRKPGSAVFSNTRTPKSKGRGLRARPAIEANTFHAPETIQEEDENIDPNSPVSPVSPKSVETVKVTNGKQLLYETFSGKFTRSQQIRRVLDHKFDLFVRLPVDDYSGRTICYGCNILPRSQNNIDRDTYSVIGRPIQDPKDYMQEPTSPFAGKAPDNSFVDTEPRHPDKMVTRIEDSLEAIDQLEDQLESFGEVANIDRVVSPEVKPPAPASLRRHSAVGSPAAPKKVVSANNTPAKKDAAVKTKPGSSRFNTLNPSSLQVSKRASFHFGADEKKTKPVVRRASLARISSLYEPKNRSSKPSHAAASDVAAPSVARKLVEEGDVLERRAAEKGGRNMLGLGRVKSAKPLTRPNFELPGDAISRRKREEREAKLKAQEEEERKRREFKAKPVRSSSVRTSSVHTYPKETIASRARMANKAATTDDGQHQAQSETTPKRLSVTTRTPLSNGTTSSLSPRGRSSMAGSSPTIHTSRATSTSTGSISGKRSNISTEDLKHRGKEVYARDNKYFEDRERERRERELAAKIARQEAAERSRQASREWAEKQRQKRISSSNSTMLSGARIVVS